MEFFIFLILFLCVFLPTWNILCSANEYIRDRTEVVCSHQNLVDTIKSKPIRKPIGLQEHNKYSAHVKSMSQGMDSLDVAYQRGTRIVSRIDERLRISDNISQLKELAIQYPITAVITLAVLATVAIPVLTFLFFALATVGVTFVGFLFVNGTVLTVAGLLFGGVICVFGTVAAGFAAVVAVAYYVVNYVITSIQSLLGQRSVGGEEGPVVPVSTEGQFTVLQNGTTCKAEANGNGTIHHRNNSTPTDWERLE